MANAWGTDTSEHNSEFNKITEGVIIGDDLTQTTLAPYRFVVCVRPEWECYMHIRSACDIVFDGINLAITMAKSHCRCER